MEFSPQDIFGLGMTTAQKMGHSYLGGLQLGRLAAYKDIAMIGFQASRVGRGGFVSSVIGQSLGIAAGVPLAGFAAAGACLIPGVGPLAAAVIGEIFADYAELRFGSFLIKKIRIFTNLDKRVRHLEMGGNYKDTEVAQRQRLIAIQDMNSSLIAGRRYLGQEALLMHR